ncbi:DUF3426 domain-containing protein [Pseudoduganella lutea]|uniref:DUF3426 domain-containing protein n=1 Tax=Pseudoduganella lutea TaxID=321985 RepID=A0A4P6L185_9BURK|nr:DUF3426 domain-containing protein [Pseudoduganella lutea]QBE64458.1 DUF3426 domain-containing protein [Pseudoduganella lutea]
MALATKCPHCHTVFRVALDQLKLRGGIVRCGACNEIFNGNAALVEPAAPIVVAPPAVPKLDLELDLDDVAVQARDALPSPSPEVPEPVSEREDPAPDRSPANGIAETADARAGDTAQADEPIPEPEPEPIPEPIPEPVSERISEPIPEPRPADPHRREPAFDMPSEHIVAVALDDLHHFDDDPEPVTPAPAPKETSDHAANEAAERTSDDAAAADLLTAAPEGALLAAGTGTAAAATDDHAALDDEPEFVRQAERRERTRSITRLAMIAGIPLLAFVLLGQTVFTLRNGLAADYPAMKPALQALCAPLGCTVELPRRIDALAIEEGELQTLAPDTYSFITVLRNQSRSVQAWPHIELVLNNGADKPVLRRVFAPRDYLGKGALAQGFRPRSEQAVKLYFKLDGLRASGYRIAIFHP